MNNAAALPNDESTAIDYILQTPGQAPQSVNPHAPPSLDSVGVARMRAAAARAHSRSLVLPLLEVVIGAFLVFNYPNNPGARAAGAAVAVYGGAQLLKKS